MPQHDESPVMLRTASVCVGVRAHACRRAGSALTALFSARSYRPAVLS